MTRRASGTVAGRFLSFSNQALRHSHGGRTDESEHPRKTTETRLLQSPLLQSPGESSVVKLSNTWIGVVLLVLVGIASLFFFARDWSSDQGDRNYQGEMPARVTVENARLVLPATAGEPAAIYMAITNVSSAGVHVTEAALEHADATMIANLETPVANEASSLYIPPGETLRLAPETNYGILTNYDSTIVPGARASLKLKFEDGGIISVPLIVQSMVQEGGTIVPPSRLDPAN